MTRESIRRAIDDALRPGHFLVVPPLALQWLHHDADETHWELFRGRALDHTQTRRRQTFEAWHLIDRRTGGEPLLAVRLDGPGEWIFVTRSILCHAWESYDDHGAIRSREVVRRVRELVGAIDAAGCTLPRIHAELIALLRLAVIGTSRLPLTSLEAPLPEFTLGQLGYSHRPGAGDEPHADASRWLADLSNDLGEHDRARLLECWIRASLPLAVRTSLPPFPTASLPALLRGMFNATALSPYTDFVTRALDFTASLVERGLISAEAEVDLHCHLLLQLGRHLTAFDLHRFHHRGANYPDALLLDEVAERLVGRPQLFAGDDAAARRRRRALRAAWLLRRQYRDQPVPDAPTSPGENARVLPSPHVRVPDAQIAAAEGRTRRLFSAPSPFEEFAAEVLARFTDDLRDPAGLRELGLGLFLDRPLGIAKPPGEPDATLLLSHLAFSPDIARQRLALLRDAGLAPTDAALDALPAGVPVPLLTRPRRPGVAAIEDTLLASRDFSLLHTTASSSLELLRQYDLESVLDTAVIDALRAGRCLVRPAPPDGAVLDLLDERGETRARLTIDVSAGYVARAGIEYVAAGLRLFEDESRRALPRLD